MQRGAGEVRRGGRTISNKRSKGAGGGGGAVEVARSEKRRGDE